MSLITLNSHALSVTIRPQEGGRLTQLCDLGTGDEWLQPGRSDYQLAPDISFKDGAWGGFDECLPSVAPCDHPDRHHGHSSVPDHGHLWSRPWRVVDQTTHSVTLDTSDVEQPVVLTRRIDIDRDAADLVLSYQLHNRGRASYRYVYSAHPLFELPGAAVVELPTGSVMRTAFGARLSPGAVGRWPDALTSEGGSIDFSLVQPQPMPRTEKVFVRSRGWCRLHMFGRVRSLLITQDCGYLQWLGVCVNSGQWPNSDQDQHWIALEPTTAPFDSLVEAAAQGWARTLQPNQTQRWNIRMRLQNAEGLACTH